MTTTSTPAPTVAYFSMEIGLESDLPTDIDIDENSEWDRRLTDQLSGGDQRYRLCQSGKEQIRRVFAAAEALGDVTVAYLEGYDMAPARVLCAGADVWLNTPLTPQEASGTSGMKAAINGVPSLIILDGWWAIGEEVPSAKPEGFGGKPGEPEREAADLYAELEHVVAPLFYLRPLAFAEVMRAAIALDGSYYNAQRTVAQYLHNADTSSARAGSSTPVSP